MTKHWRGRRGGVLLAALTLLCAGAALWILREDDPPYTLRATPSIAFELTVASDAKAYPDAAEIKNDAELLTRVYLQRLRAGDRKGVVDLGAPWYQERSVMARQWLASYAPLTSSPVKGELQDPLVPDLASVILTFDDGTTQQLGMTRADGTWWLTLGDGDPMGP
ncbi:hypothetical protein ACFVDU_00545 [Streptomyces albidoflavus]